MDSSRNNNNDDRDDAGSSKKALSSTTSLGKRRSLRKRKEQQPRRGSDEAHNNYNQKRSPNQRATTKTVGSDSGSITSPKPSDYGSQASLMRKPMAPSGELNKVAILGASGGIGQPLALLMMLHSEYVQHLALYDLVHVQGVGADLAHVDRQCKVTAHLGLEELPEAVRNAKVIVILAGLAQKPGMSRDDLFGSNAKILYNLVKVCATVAPNAHLAIVSNPVNSLVPLTCEIYHRLLQSSAQKNATEMSAANKEHAADQQRKPSQFGSCCRRIFGVTTLDVVRASSLTARSAFFKPEPNGLFKDPAKIHVPVVGGHAGKTIIPLLSQASPKLDKKRLLEERSTTQTLVESIQQAGIDVLNAKKGNGSATLAMAYAACHFTIALLRAQQGEQNIVEYAYVKHAQPVVGDLDYFATPLLLGKDGYVKALPLQAEGKPLLPYEQQMIEEGARELRTSVAKGEDFAREHLSSEKL